MVLPIDLYRRWVRPEASDAHILTVSKVATGFWGIFACVAATFAATLGSLIEVVNRFGSFFYGSILGVFLLAMIRFTRGTGAFLGAQGSGQSEVFLLGDPNNPPTPFREIGSLSVPEPGTLALLGLGLMGLGFSRRR